MCWATIKYDSFRRSFSSLMALDLHLSSTKPARGSDLETCGDETEQVAFFRFFVLSFRTIFTASKERWDEHKGYEDFAKRVCSNSQE
jgi:hypothetical protein